ncbi:MAG: RNA-binding protein [Kiritimatiellia bacterium]
MDKELLHKKVQAERKVFYISLRENPRGRVLRMTEDVGGRRDTIMIPADGLEAIRDILEAAIEIHHNTPQL